MLKLTCVTLFLVIGYAASDSINGVDYGSRIPTNGLFDVLVTYNADSSRDLDVTLKRLSDKKEFASARIKVDKGYDRKRAISVPVKSTSLTAGTGYVLEVKLLSGIIIKDTEASKVVNVTVSFGRQGFYVADGNLYDANGNEFLIRGISNAHAEFDQNGRWLAREALTNIAYSKANTVRIQWRKAGSLTAQDLDTVLDRAVKSRLIPIVELHDAVGSNDPAKLNELATWWADNVALLIKYRRYIIINLAAEWGSSAISDKFWKDSFKDAIDIIRAAGFSGTLLIDTYGEAQNPSGIKTYAARLLEQDEKNGNIIYGLHILSDWSTKVARFQIAKELQEMKSKKIPLLISSFADRYPAKINGVCVEVLIDANTVMKEALKYRIGYIGTYWAGNGNYQNCGSLFYLDVVPNMNWNTFSAFSNWGNSLINTLNVGIRDTSKMATIFI